MPSSPTLSDKWQGKPYYSLDAFFKNTYGEKIYKIALEAGLTCPNRDGTTGTGGCIFCSEGGSGDFATPLSPLMSPAQFQQALSDGKALLHKYGKKTGNRSSDPWTARRNVG